MIPDTTQTPARWRGALHSPVAAIACLLAAFVAGGTLGMAFSCRDGVLAGRMQMLTAIQTRLGDMSVTSSGFNRAAFACIAQRLTADDLNAMIDADNADRGTP